MAVARALASRPQIIFADEPTGNLDSRSGTEILDFMRRAVREMGQTIVMVTHDPVAASYADAALFLNDGKIVDQMDSPPPSGSSTGSRRSGSSPMLKVALRGLLAHKGRLLTTFLAVALGVAFMGGVLVLTDTTNRSFDDLFADVFRDTDAVVRSDQTIDSDFGEIRGQIDESLLPLVEDSDGVAEAAGSVDGYAQVIDKEGDAVGDPAMGAPTFGTNWVDIDDLNPFDLTDGRAPESAGEIVIDRGTANDTDYQVGDTVPVQTRDGVDDFELVGIVRFGTADNPGGASFVMGPSPRPSS